MCTQGSAPRPLDTDDILHHNDGDNLGPFRAERVCTGGRSYYWRITILYLHPEVLDGHVLLVDVQGVVLGHREHLLQVVLNIGAVLVVDCVSVARYWGTLVLKIVGLGSMTIEEAYFESCIK